MSRCDCQSCEEWRDRERQEYAREQEKKRKYLEKCTTTFKRVFNAVSVCAFGEFNRRKGKEMYIPSLWYDFTLGGQVFWSSDFKFIYFIDERDTEYEADFHGELFKYFGAGVTLWGRELPKEIKEYLDSIGDKELENWNE